MAYQQPYLHPSVPFTGCIQGGLHEGMAITLTGRVLPGTERFHVNLQCGTMGSPDIALHFNPRYSRNSGFVVFNTLQNSSWGSEERSRQMPLPRGSSFILTFLVNRDSYSVTVNGVHFMEYLHRLSVSRVNAISVGGGVEIESITFQSLAAPCSMASPVPMPGFLHQTPCSTARPVPLPGLVQQSQWGQSRGPNRKPWNSHKQRHGVRSQAPPPYSPPQAYIMPYKAVIQGGLYPGRTLSVQGYVNHDADRFCINLRFNSGLAFHFNPRFKNNVVVRNSLIQDRWGPEERTGGIPFYRGQLFAVTIVCDTQCYKIMVNGVQMFTYNHRYFLLQQIDILEVEGNVTLTSVSV